MKVDSLTVTINDKRIIVPQHWNDLSLKTQLKIYGTLMTDVGNILEAHEIVPFKRIEIMKLLLGLNTAFMKKWRETSMLESGDDGDLIFLNELQHVCAVTNFLFDIEEKNGNKKYQIYLGLTKCPFPMLEEKTKGKKTKKKRFYAPADGLKNITIYEMGAIFTLFEKFMQTKDESIAIKLLATIYRPSKPKTKENKLSGYKGDRRLPFIDHESTVENRIAVFEKLAKPAKQLIIFWIASCRQAIINAYPNIFESDDVQNDGNKYGWGGVLLSLSGGLIHLNEISNKKYDDALDYLSYLEDQRKLAKLNKTA